MALPDISPFRVTVEHLAINSGTQVSSVVPMIPARFLTVSVQSLSSDLRLQGSWDQSSANFRDVYISEAPGADVFTPWELGSEQAPGLVATLRPFAFPFVRAKMQAAATSPTTVTMILTTAQAR